MLGQNTICWRSRKQRCVSTSTTKAEYLALSTAAKQQVWLHSVLLELGQSMNNNPLMLHGDNKGTIELIKNPIISDRSKHIDVAYHYVRELYATKKLSVKHIPGVENPADICTKALPAPRLAYLRKMIMREELPQAS